MAINSYDFGDVVRLTATFTDSSGAAQDPGAVFFSLLDPSGNQTDMSTASTATANLTAITKSTTGIFYIDVDADETGSFRYRWYSTGTGQAADMGQLRIVDSPFSTGA